MVTIAELGLVAAFVYLIFNGGQTLMDHVQPIAAHDAIKDDLLDVRRYRETYHEQGNLDATPEWARIPQGYS